MPTQSRGELQERILMMLPKIADEVKSLATDRDIYWKVQREVIQRNPRFLEMRSPFFEMLNDAYAHGTAMRVRRLVDPTKGTISLTRLLEAMGRKNPELLGSRVPAAELAKDINELKATTLKVKGYVDQYVAHQDQSPTAPRPSYQELDTAIELLVRLTTKYYKVLAESDVDVAVSYLGDPLAIFRFAWIEASC